MESFNNNSLVTINNPVPFIKGKEDESKQQIVHEFNFESKELKKRFGRLLTPFKQHLKYKFPNLRMVDVGSEYIKIYINKDQVPAKQLNFIDFKYFYEYQTSRLLGEEEVVLLFKNLLA